MLNVIAAKGITVFATYPMHRAVLYQHIQGGSVINAVVKLVKKKKLYKGVMYQCGYSTACRVIDIEIWNRNHDKTNIYVANMSALCKLVLYPLQMMERMRQKGRKLGLFQGFQYQYLLNVVGNYVWTKSYNKLNESVKIKKKNLKNGVVGFVSGGCCEIVTNPLRVMRTCVQEGVKVKGYNYLTNGIYSKIVLNCIQSCMFNILWKKF
jgi:hypothetical protein